MSDLAQVLRLWEALWSRHISPHFHIFMCAGVLGLHRRAIMDADLDFDGILRYCIQLSGKLDLHQVNRPSSLPHDYASHEIFLWLGSFKPDL